MTNLQTITLASGCFWCTEAIFKELNGVHSLVSGYSGGELQNPTYEAVCTGKTGHAEAVQIKFDPEVLKLEDLLRIFFLTHDPTTLNRQGADVGTQYRSAIFYTTPEQKEISEKVLKEIGKEGIYKDKIVTEIEPLKNFYEAEDYHQNFFENNPNQAYCQIIIEPKVAKLRKEFLDKLKNRV